MTAKLFIFAGLDPRCQAMKLNMSFKRIPFMRSGIFFYYSIPNHCESGTNSTDFYSENCKVEECHGISRR